MIKCVSQIREVGSNNLEQLRKITNLNYQPIRKISNCHYTDLDDSEIHTDINYLSEIRAKKAHDKQIFREILRELSTVRL